MSAVLSVRRITEFYEILGRDGLWNTEQLTNFVIDLFPNFQNKNNTNL